MSEKKEKKKITEEMGVHKSWHVAAEEVSTVEQLSKFVTSLIEDYEHDYGTIVHAIKAAMTAAYKVVNRSPQGGITGFQAGCIGWMLIDQFHGRSVIGKRIMNYDHFLYPQYEEQFKPVLSKEVWEKLQATAKENLESKDVQASEKVREHWQSIVNGVVPFGYSVEVEQEDNQEEKS